MYVVTTRFLNELTFTKPAVLLQRRSPIGCGVAQTVVRRPAVRPGSNPGSSENDEEIWIRKFDECRDI